LPFPAHKAVKGKKKRKEKKRKEKKRKIEDYCNCVP